jgi:hypothetical protein
MSILPRLLAVCFSLVFAASVLAAPNRPLVPRRPGNAPRFVRGSHHHRRHVHRRAWPHRRVAVTAMRRNIKPIVRHVSPRHRHAHRHNRR